MREWGPEELNFWVSHTCLSVLKSVVRLCLLFIVGTGEDSWLRESQGKKKEKKLVVGNGVDEEKKLLCTPMEVDGGTFERGF